MAVSGFDDLAGHVGHNVGVVAYGSAESGTVNVAIECDDCGEVLVDFDRPDCEGPMNVREIPGVSPLTA